MKLSIVTVNLNNAAGLRKTMESVFSQTSWDFEYIIIDGGSTDDSVDVIKSYTNIPPGVYAEVKVEVEKTGENKSDDEQKFHVTNNLLSVQLSSQTELQQEPSSKPQSQPIVYWVSEPDHGIYHAMNKGIKVAKGEYCQFLNSGDCLATNYVIEKMLATLPECSVFCGNMLKRMPNGKIYRDTGVKEQISMYTFYKGTLNHSSALIKRDLFRKYGLYDESLKIVSDWKWYLIAIGLNNERVKYTNSDVTVFDMYGISNLKYELERQERRKTLEEILPVNILLDYDKHWHTIEQASRINKFRITKWLFWLIERILFKLQKCSIL